MAQRPPPRRYHDDTTFTQRGTQPQHARNHDSESLTLGRNPRSRHPNFHNSQNRSTDAPPLPAVPSRSSSFRTAPKLPGRVQQHSEVRQYRNDVNRHANDIGEDDSEIGSLAQRKQQLLQNFPNATLKSTHHNQQGIQQQQEQQSINPQPSRKAPKPPRPIPSQQNSQHYSQSGNNGASGVFKSGPPPPGPPTLPRLPPKSHISRDTAMHGSSSSESGSSGDGRFVRRKKAVPVPPTAADVSSLRSSLQHSETQGPIHNQPSRPQMIQRDDESPGHNISWGKTGFERAREMIRESQTTSSDQDQPNTRREFQSVSRNASIRRTPSNRSNISVGSTDSNTSPRPTFSRESRHAVSEKHTSRPAIQQHLETNVQPYISPKTQERSVSHAPSQQAVQLQNFLSTIAHLLPACVDVRQGLMCRNASISQNERLYLHFLKLCRVVVLLDLERKHHYYVPINSLQKFGIIYDPHNDIASYAGYVFQTAGDLMKASPIPSVVLATSSFDGGSPEKSVQANELLFVRGITKSTGISRARYLKVQTMDYVEKHLSMKCAGNFTTKPDAVQMHLSTLIDHYIPLPQKAILYPDSQVKHLLPSSLVLEAVILEKLKSVVTVIATVQNASSLLEITADVNLLIEPVLLNQGEQEWLQGVSYNTYKNLHTMNSVLVCGNLSSELQDKLYHCQVPSMETKGVQLYLPNVTPLPPELNNTLETQCLAKDKPLNSGHVGNSSSKIEISSSGSEEEESESSDESDDTIEEEDEEDEEEEEEEEDDEDGLYETIDDAISALPNEEAETLKLKTAAVAGASSMRSKITDMLKAVTKKRPSITQNEVQHTSAAVQESAQSEPPDSISLESDQEEYDNISYPGDAAQSVQSRIQTDQQPPPPPPPAARTRLNSTQQGTSDSTSDRESEKDAYEDFQFGEESQSEPRPEAPLTKEKPKRLVPPFFPPKLSQESTKPSMQVLQAGGDASQNTQKSRFATPSHHGSDSYEELHQLYSKLEKQVMKLTEEHRELKSAVDRLLAASASNGTKGKAMEKPRLPDVSRSKPQTEEDNRDFLARLSEHQVLMLLDRMKLSQYKQRFMEEGVSGDLLVECDQDTLRNDLEVTSRLHCVKFMLLIKGKESAQKYFQP